VTGKENKEEEKVNEAKRVNIFLLLFHHLSSFIIGRFST